MFYFFEWFLFVGIFGGIGGLFSYVVGEWLGVVNFGFLLFVVVVLLVVIWVFLLLLVFVFVCCLEGCFFSVKIFYNEV